MARASNTGPRNYPAAKVPGNSKQVIEGVKSVKSPRFPNRHMSTTLYKKTLKKEESDV